MATISPSVLKALSYIVPDGDKINFISLVEWKHIHWYLALGREFFYFIQTDLRAYKNPKIPYKHIKACVVCNKKKNLLQININIDPGLNANHPDYSTIKALGNTYPKGVLNIWSSQRKVLIESFECYWQIDNMIRTSSFGLFPLVEGSDIIVKIDHKDEQSGSEIELSGPNLKKMVRIPPPFLDFKRTIKNDYCVSIPHEFS